MKRLALMVLVFLIAPGTAVAEEGDLLYRAADCDPGDEQVAGIGDAAYCRVVAGTPVLASKGGRAYHRDAPVALPPIDVRLAPKSALTDRSGSAPWNTDILDVVFHPEIGFGDRYDGDYRPAFTGRHVYVYVLDVPVNPDWFPEGTVLDGGDATAESPPPSLGPLSATTCSAHGSLVADSIFSVAPDVSVVSIQALHCGGFGSVEWIVKALGMAAQDYAERRDAGAPSVAVANLSLGGGASDIIDQAVDDLADEGFVVVVAAGNDGDDACGISPARARHAIAAGAIDRDGAVAPFSNAGTCVDVLAPGRYVPFALGGESGEWSGTSAASPHVAAVAALQVEAAEVFAEEYDWRDIRSRVLRQSYLESGEPQLLATLLGDGTPALTLQVPSVLGVPTRGFSRVDAFHAERTEGAVVVSGHLVVRETAEVFVYRGRRSDGKCTGSFLGRIAVDEDRTFAGELEIKRTPRTLCLSRSTGPPPLTRVR